MLNMDKCIQIGCTHVIHIFYDSEVNIFYDINDNEIHYIYELITPTDMMMFKKDNGNNIFISRENRTQMIEILVDYE